MEEETKQEEETVVDFAEAEEDDSQLREAFAELTTSTRQIDRPIHFHIIRRLGYGRQGIVFHAESRGAMGCVTRHALKVYDPALYSKPALYEKDMSAIATQVSTLQRLYHPNLVQWHSFFLEQGIGCVAMELIDGLDLRYFLNRGVHEALRSQLPEEEWVGIENHVFNEETHRVVPGVAFYIVRKVLRALEILNLAGYAHCDIKPSNIMIDRFGTVKLIDFGRATRIGAHERNLLGSLMYMAPEVHRGDPVTHLSDLYSTAIVALEMLHGGYIIDPKSSDKEFYEFKCALPDRLTELLPESVCENETVLGTLRRMIEVEPENRFQTAHAADVGTEGVWSVQKELSVEGLDMDHGRRLELYTKRRLSRKKTSAQNDAGTIVLDLDAQRSVTNA